EGISIMEDTRKPRGHAADDDMAPEHYQAERLDGSKHTSSIPNYQRGGGKLKVSARVITAIGERDFTVVGQTARTLLALNEARMKGCTALEVSTWALRFAAYCHVLIHDHDLNIITMREEHSGGWHGRHVLLDHVTITSVTGTVEKVL
ncbi:hypothetical protein H261_19189, partial [Paramagnetospirillum caucaseum]